MGILERFLVSGAIVLLSCAQALAHPHVFVDGHVVLDADKDDQLTAVKNIWEFDAPFSAYAIRGLDKNRDGKLEPSELRPLAHTSMDSLKDYHFFTYVTSGGHDETLGPPRDALYTWDGKRLTLTFTMPLEKPVPMNDKLKVEVFDPEYFVAFSFPFKGDAVAVHGDACTARYKPPKPLDAQMVAELAAVPIDQHDLPRALKDAAIGLAHLFLVACPGKNP